ncbi:uncharacterized protein ACJ7VT_001421 [Polymixia lowei]
MGESVDVKALRAKFHAKANMADSSSHDSGSPKSPLPGLGRGAAAITENGLAQHRLSPVTTNPRFPGPPKPEPRGSASPRPPLPQGPLHRPALTPGVRPPPQPSDQGKVKQTGELLQNMMLRHQKLPSPKINRSTPAPGHSSPTRAPGLSTPAPGPSTPTRAPGPSTPTRAPGPSTPTRAPAPSTTARQLPSRGGAGEVPPLKRNLPPEGPRPMKPRRPPKVNLEPYRRTAQAPPPLPAAGTHPAMKKNDGPLSSGGRRVSSPGLSSPQGPPRPPNKPSGLTRQPSPEPVEDNQDTYDDIGSFEKSDSWNGDGSQHMDRMSDDSEVYECIDENQLDLSQSSSDKKTQKEVKRQQEQEKKDLKERQKRENEMKKKFQIQGQVEVIHIARVRHDWHGGKLDLSLREGENVEILRLGNNPGGKWLARTLTGKYGYISNTCVDVDYEEVKRKAVKSIGLDKSPLPPPPPDPPRTHPIRTDPTRTHPIRTDPTLTDDIYYDVDSTEHGDSLAQEEDDYDDVEPIPEDFPPPPPEIGFRLDPKMEKELRKKFKYEGSFDTLHVMMVDPNGVIKKPAAKHLAVAQGEILHVIQLTNNKKALCRNQFGKYGYVSRTLLLPMEGDIYDDIEHIEDIYDNDSIH